MKLDRQKGYGQIWGHSQAMFEQDGMLFNCAGNAIAASAVEVKTSAPVLAKGATEFLRALLHDGAVPATQIRADAEAAGYSWRTVQRVKAALGVLAVKEGRGGWVWKTANNEIDTRR